MKNKILMLTLMIVLAFMACEKDPLNNGNGNNGNGGNNGGGQQGEMIGSLSNLWQDQRAAQTQTFNITVNNYTEIVGQQGTKIRIYSTSFLLNGAPVTGAFQVELIEAYDKGAVIGLGLNTMGRDLFGNYGAMVSAGEFYINATQNGQALTINPRSPITVSSAPFPDGDFNNAMIPLLLEADTAVGDSVWVPIDSASMGNCRDSSMINLGQSTYCFEISDNARWINCDYFANFGVALTNMTVNLPNTYNATNTEVLISFDGLNLVTNLHANSGSSFSLGNFYQVPIGQAIHLIVIAEQNGNLVYHIQSLNIANNQVVTLTPTDLTGTTVANLQTQLSNLP